MGAKGQWSSAPAAAWPYSALDMATPNTPRQSPPPTCSDLPVQGVGEPCPGGFGASDRKEGVGGKARHKGHVSKADWTGLRHMVREGERAGGARQGQLAWAEAHGEGGRGIRGGSKWAPPPGHFCRRFLGLATPARSEQGVRCAGRAPPPGWFANTNSHTALHSHPECCEEHEPPTTGDIARYVLRGQGVWRSACSSVQSETRMCSVPGGTQAPSLHTPPPKFACSPGAACRQGWTRGL